LVELLAYVYQWGKPVVMREREAPERGRLEMGAEIGHKGTWDESAKMSMSRCYANYHDAQKFLDHCTWLLLIPTNEMYKTETQNN
jgi:hypothetical protein